MTVWQQRSGFAPVDRALLRWTAWTLASAAAVVTVTTAAGVIAWWRLAGTAGIGGGSRLWPIVAFTLLGGLAALALYGLSRACRAVERLADAPAPPHRARRTNAPPRWTSAPGSSRSRVPGQA